MSNRTPEEIERIERIKKERLMLLKERHERMIEQMKTMKPFTSEDGIIDVPITDSETYKNIVIPNFIRCGAIPKAQLEVGKTYIGSCRNASEAVWKGDHFTYKRYKFGYTFDEDINHFEDDDGYDLFVPIKLKEDE